MPTSRPNGVYFTEVYRVPGPPNADSARARRRLGHFLRHHEEVKERRHSIAAAAEIRFGSGPPWYGSSRDWVGYLKDLSADDFLDFVTLVVDALQMERDKLSSGYFSHEKERIRRTIKWIAFAQVVREQNLGFEVDAQGGVHPKVDSYFQRAKQEIIRGLNAPGHGRVEQCVEDAYKHFDEGDNKQSIWSMFEALETLFQRLVGDRLNRGSIENKLAPLLIQKFSSDEAKTWESIAKSLSDWADAFHQYRHGQAGTEPRAPSQTLRVYALSSGASVARVLLDLISVIQQVVEARADFSRDEEQEMSGDG